MWSLKTDERLVAIASGALARGGESGRYRRSDVRAVERLERQRSSTRPRTEWPETLEIHEDGRDER
jgi:hypothetical protein